MVPSPSPSVLEEVDDARLGVGDVQPVERDALVGAVDRDAVAEERLVVRVALGRLDGADDRDVELLGELPVARVLPGHGHDGAGAVAHQHVVGDEDRDALSRQGIRRPRAGEDTGLVLALGLALDVTLARRRELVCRHGLLRGRARVGVRPLPGVLGPIGPVALRHQGVDERVLGRDDHEGRAEDRVGARREDVDAVLLARAGDDGEGDAGALGPADPVALHELDLLGPVDTVEVVGQAVGIRRDAHLPLAEVAPEDREVAALGAALVGDLLVGEHGAEAGAPVDRRLGRCRRGGGPRGPWRARSRTGRPSRGRRRRATARRPDSNSSTSSLIGRALPRPPSSRTASASYQASQICRKIHCVQR